MKRERQRVIKIEERQGGKKIQKVRITVRDYERKRERVYD